MVSFENQLILFVHTCHKRVGSDWRGMSTGGRWLRWGAGPMALLLWLEWAT
jgi:hypothetical protein